MFTRRRVPIGTVRVKARSLPGDPVVGVQGMIGSFKVGWRGSDFAWMGRGIEGRFERCRRWWEPHIRNTREFIEKHVPPSGTVAVFGAGRLLDIDLKMLLERCSTIHLYDADPSCVATWKRVSGRMYGTRVIGHQVDITDTLEKWSSQAAAAHSAGRLVEFLRSCEAPVPSWVEDAYDGVISLNVLGQIPLYWRDRMWALAPRRFDALWVELERSMAELQRAHIDGVLTQRNAWSILISDSEYYFYQSDSSDWRVEPALFGTANTRLRDTVVSRGGYGSWLWHVAPQYVECDDEGEIHKVEAFFWTGKDL